MLDLKLIRSEPETVRTALARRGDDAGAEHLDEILELDELRRTAVTEGDELRARRNEVSRTIGELKREGKDADALIAEMREVGARVDELESRVTASEERIQELLLNIPNMPLAEVQAGGEYLFTATVSRGGEIQVSRGSAIADDLEHAIDRKDPVTVVPS